VLVHGCPQRTFALFGSDAESVRIFFSRFLSIPRLSSLMTKPFRTSYSDRPELEKLSELRAKTERQVVSLIQSKLALGLNFVALVEQMIAAYRAGIPRNGRPVPDGAKMAKVHWAPKPNEFFPEATVPGKLANVDFMVKDSKRFADSGGWGYAVFDYEAASDTFKPGTLAGTPPQGNDAKCGFACHTRAKTRDYVFTDYGQR